MGPRLLLALIVLWGSVFTMVTGLTGGLMSLLVVRFLFGTGEAGAYPAMSVVVSRWLPTSERGLAQGFIWGASRLGGVLSPLIVVPVQQADGWRAAFFILGALGFVWAAAWWLWFRNRPKEKLGIMDYMLPCAWALCVDVGQKYSGIISGAMITASSLGGFLYALILAGW